MYSRFLAALLLLLTGGCSTLVLPNVDPVRPIDPSKHLIYVDAQGDLIDPVIRDKVIKVGTAMAPIEDGSTSCLNTSATDEQLVRWQERRKQQSLELAYVRAVIDGFLEQRKQQNHIQPTLHIHGGLNTLNGVVERAEVLPGYMLLEGHYPIMFGWPSGFLRSYKDHLVKSDRGRQRNNALTVFFGTMTYIEDIVRSLVRAPSAIVRQIDNAMIVPISRESAEERDAEGRGSTERLKASGFKVHDPEPYVGVGQTYFPSIVNPVGWIATPFRDGLGSGAWDAMLRQTELILTKASIYEGSLLPIYPCGGALPDLVPQPGDTAATMFLLEWQRDERTRAIPLNVIGHSMGAIVTLQLLSRHPGVRFKNVVFMGAAARIKDVESILIPWLANHREARFYNLSLDPYNEIAERTYYDFVPRGSLLMWIDDTFGTVNSFRDRTVGKWWNVIRIADDLFPRTFAVQDKDGAKEHVEIRSRVVLKRFAINTDGSLGPQTHGDFNRYCFWQKDFWDSAKPAKPLWEESFLANPDERLLHSCVVGRSAVPKVQE